MKFQLEDLIASLAAYLSPYFPDVAFYQDPNQQGTKTPCFFLQQRYANIQKQIGPFWLLRIGLDLTYLENYNLPDLQQRYSKAAGILDPILETFPYWEGGEGKPVRLRTYDRKWDINLDALHYAFEIKERVALPEIVPKMEEIEEYHEVIKHGANG